MAKTSKKIRQSRKPRFSTQAYTRCRICFRELAYKGEIPGVKKAIW